MNFCLQGMFFFLRTNGVQFTRNVFVSAVNFVCLTVSPALVAMLFWPVAIVICEQ
jgi:hypothetical protein